MAKTISAASTNLPTVKSAWIESVERLICYMTAWLSDAKRSQGVDALTVVVNEQGMGAYEAPGLRAKFDDGDITIEPKGRNFPGQGVVWMQAWPT